MGCLSFSMGTEDTADGSPTCALRVQESGEPLVLALIGEADLYHVSALRTSLMAAVCDTDRETIILDLSGCDYMDSSVVKALISVARAAHEQKKQFLLARPTINLRRTFELVHMERFCMVIEAIDLLTSC